MESGGVNKASDLFIALGHPVRRRILRRMFDERGEISPRELATALSEPLSGLSYHVRVLAECEAIELVGTKKVRGTTQHFYRPAIGERWARTALRAESKIDEALRREEKG
jgi:DNA-binding transcriptional ArsR family regulator